MSKGLSKFFEPESVSVIGASGTPHKPGNDVIRNILANEYGGKLYLVNPKGGEIHGIKVHRSIQELPKGIDLAIIILPADRNMLAIRDCVDQGIEYFVLAAGGFSEVQVDHAGCAEPSSSTCRFAFGRLRGPVAPGRTDSSESAAREPAAHGSAEQTEQCVRVAVLVGPFHGSHNVVDLGKLVEFPLPFHTRLGPPLCPDDGENPLQVLVACGGWFIGGDEPVECVKPDGLQQPIPA